MRKSSLSFASLLAVAGLTAGATQFANGFPSAEAPPVKTPRFNRHSAQSRTLRRPGRVYPEQSSRQALRGARRAQGGAGIELINGRYKAVGRESCAL